jgi:hypothetical protein
MGPGEEKMCIYCSSLQTSLSLVTLALLHCFYVGCGKSTFLGFGRESLAISSFKQFSHKYGSLLSIHGGLFVL